MQAKCPFGLLNLSHNFTADSIQIIPSPVVLQVGESLGPAVLALDKLSTMESPRDRITNVVLTGSTALLSRCCALQDREANPPTDMTMTTGYRSVSCTSFLPHNPRPDGQTVATVSERLPVIRNEKTHATPRATSIAPARAGRADDSPAEEHG